MLFTVFTNCFALFATVNCGNTRFPLAPNLPHLATVYRYGSYVLWYYFNYFFSNLD
nr:MAG TPA: hypothetical protein [Caudoviricetes sp.]